MRTLKYIVVVGMNILITVNVYSQSQSNGSILLLSETDIYYTPKKQFANISLSFVRFEDDKHGVQFVLTTKHRRNQPSIRTDSILLHSGSKILAINKLYSDTIYWKENGSLCLTSTYLLNQKEMEFLKEGLITKMIFMVDEHPAKIKISTRSQQRVKEIASCNY